MRVLINPLVRITVAVAVSENQTIFVRLKPTVEKSPLPKSSSKMTLSPKLQDMVKGHKFLLEIYLIRGIQDRPRIAHFRMYFRTFLSLSHR